MNKMASIFTKILNGEIPGEKVYEDEDFFAILDIKPVNKGHVLVIPKEEYKDITEMPEELAGKYLQVAKKVGESLMKSLNCEGFNIMMNNKAAAGQIIFHAHIHVVPRFEGDGLKHWPGTEYNTLNEQKEYAEKIRKEI